MTRAKMKDQPSLLPDDAPEPKMKDVTPPKTRPLTEGKVRKGGRNEGPSQIQERPQAPAPINAPKKRGPGKSLSTITAAPPIPEGKSVLAMIGEAANNPDFNPENMRALLDMQKEIMAEQQRRDFNTAFAAMQAELPTIKQDGRIEVRKKDGSGERTGAIQQSTPYATFNNIMKVVKPILSKYGFSIWFATEPTSDGRILVKGFLDHNSGGQRSTAFPLPAETSGSKNNVQGWGSSLSYGKRYATIALLNIVSEAKEDRDDDGYNLPNLKPAKDGGFVQVEDRATVSQEQVEKLVELIEWCGVSKAKFTAHYSIGKISDLPADLFDAAVKSCQDFHANRQAQRNG